MQTFDTCVTEEEAVTYIQPLIEVLDQMRPDWALEVELHRLDMFAVTNGPERACLFAQLFGDWGDGKVAVYGFVQDHDLDLGYEYISNSTAAFQGTIQHRAWERVIGERQAVAA